MASAATVEAPSSLASFSLTPSSRAVLFLIARLGTSDSSRKLIMCTFTTYYCEEAVALAMDWAGRRRR
jgi:hypothetical protein